MEKAIQLMNKPQLKVCEPVSSTGICLSADCVIFGFDEGQLKVLLVRSDDKEHEGQWSLPGTMVEVDEDIDAAASRVLKERTGLEEIHLEQVSTFGAPDRCYGKRVVSVVYYSLVNIQQYKLAVTGSEEHWLDIRSVKELALDYRIIFDRCLLHLQKRVQEHPVGCKLLPKKFSLRDLQYLYEAILQTKMDRRNFRKKFLSMGFLVDLNEMEKNVPHRPGKLYRFDFDKYEANKKKWVAIDF